MYLKRIEIHGFKSFSNLVQIDFSKRITTIIGSSNTGKSNIVDAIKWVLGEQGNKSLRIKDKRDVIFHGDEKNKALGFSEIRITLDNSDQKLPIDRYEVLITKRIYLSGDTEYYINYMSCRLRDVNELLYDSGIGNSYFIVGQGTLDNILSKNKKDRKVLFEEAIDIVRYKSRKMQFEKILKEKKQNFERISNLIIEISSMMERETNSSEYEKWKERCDFLTRTNGEQDEAIEKEYKTIASLSSTIESQYIEKISQISKTFDQYIKSLFGDGQGAIVYTDPENAVESNIAILVKLPDCDKTEVSLLPQEKKTLISLALLFSILESRGNSVCIIDEIEQSLSQDELPRFIELMKSAINTQFILFSKNEKVAELTDSYVNL